jgi:ABC-2 type transport system permease protein
MDSVAQPVITATIEATLWTAILASIPGGTLGGFGREYYLGYALWANFLGRVTTNWMYEFNMHDDIETGRINSILVRPISFYEFYLSQLMGYKLFVAVTSFFIPVLSCWLIGGAMHVERLPLVLLLVAYYLLFVHTLSFITACLAFFISRAGSFTGIKNMAMWILAGEMIPLDLYPEPLKTWMIRSPFAAGVYVPVGYITGRFDSRLVWETFVSITIGLVVVGLVARVAWRMGLRSYTGTGA